MTRQSRCNNALLRAGYPTFFSMFAILFLLGTVQSAQAASVVRKPMEPGVMIALKGGRTLYLECRPPQSSKREAFLKKYLADPGSAGRFKSLSTVPLMYKDLKPSVQRKIMETMFPQDFANPAGWWHTVTYDGAVGVETWWNLAEWLTGKGTNYKALESLKENRAASASTLVKGQVLFFPRSLLLAEFQKLSPDHKARMARLRPPAPRKNVRVDEDDKAFVEDFVEGELRYGSDSKGNYAAYKMKKGEALYTSVVIRFTEFREVTVVNEVADEILKRNRISNPRHIHVGKEIKIPLDMISDRYLPKDSERRQAFEASHAEVVPVRPTGRVGKGLDGVVVILDPGHGGADQGTHHGNVFEDELTYDIAVRIKKLLESSTRVRVHMTLHDKSQGDTAHNGKRFRHDEDEVVLTTPNYAPNNTRVSANLRWYLANDIYRKELARGIKAEDMLFASIHCDALYYKLRGSMVYVPGAAYRDENEAPPSSGIYNNFKEAREHRTVRFTKAELRRDEAMSRGFAKTLLRSLRSHNPRIAVHRTSDPIRNVIQRTRTKRYVPTVLRNTLVPTKVLVETANLKNPTDRERLSDPKWRQWYAEAFVAAVKAHYSS
ncbi:MAG: N-acetylmuramoyl-L-alanine amidase [Candidatus Hydrogenedentes bacterium]|nr:N-acetylmuramoyl-L-alanine amidase [Candidatus Hydrogenedentota bacterium]